MWICWLLDSFRFDRIINCGKLWCRKWDNNGCSVWFINNIGGVFSIFWWDSVFWVCVSKWFVSSGFSFFLFCSVCSNKCFSGVLRLIIWILFLSGNYCWVIVCFNVMCMMVVNLCGLFWMGVCFVSVLRMVCILWIGIFLLRRFCSILCSVVSVMMSGMRFFVSFGIFWVMWFNSCCVFWWLNSFVVCWLMRWLRCVVIIVLVLIIVYFWICVCFFSAFLI